MKKLMLLLLITTPLFAQTEEPKFEFTPIIKSELCFIGGEDLFQLYLGEQNYGISVTRGNTNATAVIDLSTDVVDSTGFNIGFGVEKATISQQLNDMFSLKFGYDVIPFGFWTSNSVNYPFARDNREQHLELALGIETYSLQSEISFYQGTDGKLNSLAGEIRYDMIVLEPTFSFKTDGFHETSISIGASVDLGRVLMNTAYFTGVSYYAEDAGVYFEITGIPVDYILITLRAETINDKRFTDGETQFSLSTMSLLNEHLYVGVEFNTAMSYDAMDDPFYSLNMVIGYEF